MDAEYFSAEHGHMVYRGDTPLHLAAVAHNPDAVRALLAEGADVAAVNRFGDQPLHYATHGSPTSPRWDPEAQAETIRVLLAAGADPNGTTKRGVAPLHRAVRCRCAAAVAALLEGGADPLRPNGNGSTPLRLAMVTSGRGGSGAPEAKAQQAEIIRLLKESGGTVDR